MKKIFSFLSKYVIPILIGILIGFYLNYFGFRAIVNFIVSNGIVIIGSLCLLVIILWIIYNNIDKVIGKEIASYRDMFENAGHLYSGHLNKEDPQKMIPKVKELATQVGVKVGEVRTRRFLMTTIMASFTVMAGFVTFSILENQNKLIENQNKLIENEQIEQKLNQYTIKLERIERDMKSEYGKTKNLNDYLGLHSNLRDSLTKYNSDYIINLENITIDNDYLYDYDFNGASLYGFSAIYSSFKNVIFSDSNLNNSNFWNVSFLEKCSFDSVYINNSVFEYCDFGDASMKGIRYENINSMSFKGSVLINVRYLSSEDKKNLEQKGAITRVELFKKEKNRIKERIEFLKTPYNFETDSIRLLEENLEILENLEKKYTKNPK